MRLLAGVLLFLLPVAAWAQSSTPYGGAAISLPGRVEAEKYDLGGEGVAFHDSDASNTGGSTFRTDGVDLVNCTDTGCGQAVSNIAIGEWLKYTVSSSTFSTYTFNVRVATPYSGAYFHVEVDNTNVTGSLAIPNTGSFSTWQTVTLPNVPVASGTHVVKLVPESNLFNVNWLEFVEKQTPYSGAAIAIPGRIEFEAYDIGGEGFSYHDSDTTNSGGALRTDGVDIASCNDGGQVYCMVAPVNGEWLEYTINNSQAGLYDATVRYASNAAGGFVEVYVDGIKRGVANGLIDTGGTSKFFALGTTFGIIIPAGIHTLRFGLTGTFGTVKLNYVDFLTPKQPFGGTAKPVPGKLEAEEYDTGNTNPIVSCSDAPLPCSALSPVQASTSPNYTFDSAIAGPYDVALRVLNSNATATPHLGTASFTVPNTNGQWQTVSSTLTLGMGRTTLGLSNSSNIAFALNWLQFSLRSTPYQGTAWPVPAKVEAEDFDAGNEGGSYHDTDSTNSGGQYRSTGVDIEATTDIGAGYDASMVSGEWLQYTVNVPRPGMYTLRARVAASSATTLSYSGYDLGTSGSISVAATGGPQSWATFSSNLVIPAGVHILKMTSNGTLALNWIQFDATEASNLPPSVSLTSPVPGASVGSGQSFTLSASASDSDGTVAKVEFFAGGNPTPLCTALSAPFTCSASIASAGPFTITAKATDNLGVSTTSGGVAITVSTQPVVTLTSPVAGAYALGGGMTFAANAAESGGSIVRVEFYAGVSLICTVTAEPFACGWNSAVPGSFSITAKAYDAAGTSVTSAPAAVVVDTLPAVALTTPVGGASFAAGSIVPMSASASDADGTIAKVQFFDGSTLVGEKVGAPYDFLWSGASTGIHTLTAKAYDDLGLASVSGEVSAAVGTPPTVSVAARSASVAPNVYRWPAAITLSAPATPVSPATSIVKVEYYADNALLATVTGAPFEYGWNSAGVGTHTYYARVYDNLGLSTQTATQTLIVDRPPDVHLVTPAQGQVLKVGASMALEASAGDEDGSIDRVEFYDGTSLLAVVVQPPYRYTWAGGALGVHSVRATAFDDLEVASTETATMYIDTPPTTTLTAPVENDGFAPGATIPLAASLVTSNLATPAYVEFYADNALVGTDTTAPFTFDWSGASSAPHQIKAKGYDSNGLFNESPVAHITIAPQPTVSLWTADPTWRFWAVRPGETQEDGPAVTATVTPVGGTSITRVEFYQGSRLMATDTTAPYTVQWKPVEDGSVNVTAKAFDSAGGVGTSPVMPIGIRFYPNVDVTSPAPLSFLPVGTTIQYTAQTYMQYGIVTKVQFFVDGGWIGEDTTPPFSFPWTVTSGDHTLYARAFDDADYNATYSDTITVHTQTPYGGSPRVVPGLIEAEAYNVGSSGYSDTTPGNQLGQFRADDVDIAVCQDTGGGYAVSIVANESLTYAINVTQAGTYSLNVRHGGPNAGQLVFQIDDTPSTDFPMALGTTSGLQVYKTTSLAGLQLSAGPHKLRLKSQTFVGYINWIQIVQDLAPTVTLNSPSPVALQPIRFSASGSTATVPMSATAGDPDPGQSIQKVDFYADDAFLVTDSASPYDQSRQFAPGIYAIRAVAYDNYVSPVSSDSATAYIAVNQAELPYGGGTPPTLGSGHVEAENFNLGGWEVAYHLTHNDGLDSGLRKTFATRKNEAVKVSACTGSPGCAAVVVSNGDWLRYKVTVPQAPSGNFTLSVGAYSAAPGASIRLKANNLYVTGAISVPVAPSGFSFTDPTAVPLTAGTSVLQVEITGDVVLDWIDLTPQLQVTLTTPVSGTGLSSGSSIVFSSSVLPAGSAVEAMYYQVYDTFYGAWTDVCRTESSENGWQCTWPDLPDGTYQVRAGANSSGYVTTVSTNTATVVVGGGSSNQQPDVALVTPTVNQQFANSAEITASAIATDHDGSIKRVVFQHDNVWFDSVLSEPYVASWKGATAGAHTITATAYDDKEQPASTSVQIVVKTTGSTQTPYGGTAPVITTPGTTRIQAENFDNGGEGVAFHDEDQVNDGNVYRLDVGVDISNTTDSTDGGQGYNVGTIRSGEWLEYTVNVQQAGSYTVTLRYLCFDSKGGNAYLQQENDGAEAALATFNLSYSGLGWKTLSVPGVALPAGTSVLRLSGSVNTGFNWLEFSTGGSTPPTQETYYFHHTNAQGSVVSTTNINGTLVSSTHYRPFGAGLARNGGTSPTRLGYTGKLMDNELALYYYGARYYDPLYSRFLSIDPSDFSQDNLESFNRYSYVLNNPFAYVDPDGKNPQMAYANLQLWNWAKENPGKAAGAVAVGVAMVYGGWVAIPYVFGTASAVATDAAASGVAYAVGANYEAIVVSGEIIAGTTAGFASGSMVPGITQLAPTSASITAKGPLGAQLTLEEGESVFVAGGLHPDVIAGSKEIIPASLIGNKNVPAGFSKYSTESFRSPAGSFKVHFYMNPETKQTYFGTDWKAVLNGMPEYDAWKDPNWTWSGK